METTAVLGRPATGALWADDPNERRKAMFAYSLQGLAALTFDNIADGSEITCPVIEEMLTSPTISDRVLGVSDTRTALTSTIISFNGNNIRVGGALSSRLLGNRLATDDPRPEDRAVTHTDPIAWTGINRPRLLQAFYTLLRYGGRNRPDGQVPQTRFPTWWTLVGWPIELAAELYDPTLHFDLTECFKATEAQDTRKAGVVAALNLLRRQFGSVPRGVTIPQSVRFGSAKLRDILDAGEQGRANPGNSNSQAQIDLAGEFLDLFEALYGKRLRSPSKSKIGEALETIKDRPENLDPTTIGILRLSVIHGLWWFHVETHTPTGVAKNSVFPAAGSAKGAQREPPTPDKGGATGPEEEGKGGRGLALSPLGTAAEQVPETPAEALQVIAQIEADADAQTDRILRGLIGFDIETMANTGEEVRPPVRIKRDGSVVQKPSLDPKHLRRKSRPKSTAGLDPHRSAVRLAQLYGGGDVCLVLDTRMVPLKALAPVLGRRKVVIHNAAFELAFLNHAGIAVESFECTMQAAGLMLGTHRRGLDDAAMHYLHIELPKDLQLSDWGATVLSPGQITYATLDAIVALKLWPLLRRDIIKAGRAGACVLQRGAIAPTARMQARGVLLDCTAHQQQIDRWSLQESEACQAFLQLHGTPLPKTPRQIAALLRQVLPAAVLSSWPRTGKTYELATTKANLKRHAGVPEIALVLANKRLGKLLSTFGAVLAARAHADGRIRASFNLAEAKTGRMSCSDPNLQQLPRDREVRNWFAAVPGNLLVVGDFTTMELRSFAEITGDTVMRGDFAKGVDLHDQQAAAMNGIAIAAVTREQRNGAKAINFGIIYGAGGAGLAASAWANYGIELTPGEAGAARDRFFARYRNGADWMRLNADLCQRRGYILIGKYGRVIMAEWESQPVQPAYYRSDDDDEDSEDDDDDYWPPVQRPATALKYTLCCNAPVQGACAEIGMRVMILIDLMLTEADIPGGLVLAVHDEWVLEVPEERAEEAARLLKQAMVQAFTEYFPNAPVNGLVKVHIAERWGDAKA
jgi:DNA polymerase-1